MKTVVTGGAGFIGSHLVKRLLDDGRDVLVAGDMSQTGTSNLDRLGIEVECRHVDLRDYEQTLNALDSTDTVFHLAARIGSLEYLHGSEMAEQAAFQTNFNIDTSVFRACLEKGVNRLIYTSSVAVYPMHRQYSPGATFAETDLDLQSGANPLYLDPDGGYGWAKLMGELVLNRTEGMAVGIARIFNVYGENEPLDEKAHVVGDCIRKALLYPDVEFRVWGSGEQTRDFLHVSDCVEALLKIEEKASCPPLVLNIGSGKATAIREVVERIVEISGNKIEPIWDESTPTGPVSRTADINKARAVLNWQQEISLDEGLRKTYYWIQRALSE
ncbi:MAG TPA: NAD-dependent epimerase/dehydratase family protein [Dehalococcoidia bacterium]|nr:NAD-dependent epimerase/dehydratase family protein [Dehalococcoidia bacterium]